MTPTQSSRASQPITPMRVAITFGFRLGSSVYLGYGVLLVVGLLVYLLADYVLPFGTSESLVTYVGAWVVVTFMGLFQGGILAYMFATLFVVVGVSLFSAIIARLASPPPLVYSTLLGGMIFAILEIPVIWLAQLRLPSLYFWLFAGLPGLVYAAIGLWTGFRLPRFSREFLARYSLIRESVEQRMAEVKIERPSRPRPNHDKNTRASLIIVSVIGFGLITFLNSVEWVWAFGFMMLAEYGLLYALVYRIAEVSPQTKWWFAILTPLAIIGSVVKTMWLVAR